MRVTGRGERRARRGLFGPAFGVLMLLTVASGTFVPSRAYAQCETAESTNWRDTLKFLVEKIADLSNRFDEEMANFIQLRIGEAATQEMKERLTEYDENMYEPLNNWWDDGENDQDAATKPALKAMTRQISLAKLLQTMHIGMFIDARAINEKIRARQMSVSAGKQMYQPSSTSCQIDAVGPGQTKTYEMSRALSRAFAYVSTQSRTSYMVKPDSPYVEGQVLNSIWNEYTTRYCAGSAGGDQGCTTPAPFAGKDTDISGYLWGDQQTFDCTDKDVLTNMQVAQRTLIDPIPPSALPAQVLGTSVGHEEMMWRRSRDARVNTIYAVMGQMMAERCSGSGYDINPIRTATGLPASTTATDASYSEIRKAMTKDRFLNPYYAARLVTLPSAIMREQNVVDVIQSQLMDDWSKRTEEAYLMEMATFADDLDTRRKPTKIRVK